MKKSLILVIILSLFSYCRIIVTSEEMNKIVNKQITRLKNKYPIPKLTKEQMYQDFDTLNNIFKYYNPQLDVRKQVTGVDILAELAKIRNEIDTITSIENYITLLYRALKLSQDRHCDIAPNLWYYRSKDDGENFNKKSFGLTFHYNDLIKKNIVDFLKLKYIEGNYFLLYPLKIFRKNDSLIIPAGAEIKAINNISVSEYVKGYKDIQWDIKWDFKNNCFYANTLKRFSTYKLLSIKYYYKNQFFYSDSVINFKQLIKQIDYFKHLETQCVRYGIHDSLLYIRCPEMFDYEFYEKEIRKLKNKPVKKVIVDIRGNFGGDDTVWISILKNIIDKPIESKITYLSKPNEKVKAYIKKQEPVSNLRTTYTSWDKNNIYNVAGEDHEKIEPTDSSLRYNGKIYILQDEQVYSAAASLTAMCQYEDQLVSIGIASGILGGRGIVPMTLQLPITKFNFMMEILIDNTNAVIAKDIYHEKVEMPITVPIDYYIDRETNRDSIYTEHYLYNHDYLFKKVLEIK